MKEVARDSGCRKVWLNVRTGNSIAIRVFKKVGFEFVGEIDIQREMELIIKKARKRRTA
jgi:ribosomal protein S18 acetylase RimI-like enzyme